LAAVVLIAVIVGVIIIFAGGGGESAKANKPADVVKGYLEALARGDAEAALGYAADTPGNKDFLTDDILKQQIAKWPITNIRILNDAGLGVGDLEFVHVAVNFGDQSADQNLNVKKDASGAWKLEHGAVKVEFYSDMDQNAMKTATLFGKPINGAKEVYVFPGWTDWGNSNPYLKQDPPKAPLLLGDLSSFSSSASMNFNFDISDQGKTAALDAVKAAIANCARSTSLRPPNCPQGVRDPSLVDGTAVWTAPADLSDLETGFFDSDKMTVSVRGEVDFQLSARSTTGSTDSGTVSSYLSADADLTTTPPTITME
jgi:hypothetical protein